MSLLMARFGSNVRFADDNEIYKAAVENHCLIETDRGSDAGLHSAKIVVPAIEVCYPFDFHHALIYLLTNFRSLSPISEMPLSMTSLLRTASAG